MVRVDVFGQRHMRTYQPRCRHLSVRTHPARLVNAYSCQRDMAYAIGHMRLATRGRASERRSRVDIVLICVMIRHSRIRARSGCQNQPEGPGRRGRPLALKPR
jgi:hypothetical protein